MDAAKKFADKKNLQELVPLNALSDSRFADLARKIEVKEVRKGRYLFRKGDRDNHSVYVLDGKVNLIDGHRKVTGAIEAGTEDSRYPIANQQPRSTSARAATKVVIARIDSGLLDVFLTWNQASGTEVEEINAADNEDWMTRMLQSEAFSKIPPSIMQRLLMKVESVPVTAGEVIINQGDEGDFFYTIHQGRCAVTRRSAPDSEDELLAELSEGDSFGEDALVSDARRNATITMTTDGVLMRLAEDDFVELLQKYLVQNVSFDRATEMVDEGAVWVDVRTSDEYESGAFEDSVNIPLNDLRDELPQLVFNAKYVLCCDTGRRSTAAAFTLSHHGFEVFVLKGGLDGLNKTADAQPGLSEAGSGTGHEATAVQDAEIIEFAHGQKGVPAENGNPPTAAGTVPPAPGYAAEIEALREELARLREEARASREVEQDLTAQQTRIEQVQQEVADRDAQLSALQSRLESEVEGQQLLRDQYAALREESAARVSQLEQALDQSRERLDTLLAETDTSEQEKLRLIGEVEADHQARHEGLEKELAESRQLAESLQVALAEAHEQTDQLRGDADNGREEQRRQVEELSSELTQSRAQVEDLEQQIRSIRDNQQAFEGDADAAAAAQRVELEQVREELAQSRKNAEELQAQIGTVQEERQAAVEGADAAAAAQRVELEQVREELAQSRKHAEELQAQIGTVQEERQAAEESADVAAAVQRETLAGLQQQYDELREKLERGEELKRESQQQLDELTVRHDTEKSELLSLSDRLKQELEAADTGKKDLVQQLEALRQAHQEKLAEADGRSKEAHITLEQLQKEWGAERDGLNEEIDAGRKRLADLGEELAQVREATEQEKQRLEAELRNRAKKSNEQLEQQERHVAELGDEISRIGDELQTLTGERDKLHEQLHQATWGQSEQQQEIENLNATIASMKDAAADEVAALSGQLEEERQCAARADQQVNEQAAQIEDLRGELAGQAEEGKRLVLNAEALQKQLEKIQQKLQQAEEQTRALDLEHQESIRKAADDLARKNDAERELQAQVERLRKKLDQSAGDLQVARNEARESAEYMRGELQKERQARAEERAQMAARQKEIKEQLTSIANEHEEVLSSQQGVLAQAKDDAREEERTRLMHAMKMQEQSADDLDALREELNRAHEETALVVRQERERYEADLALIREQKAEADTAATGFKTQLEQLAQERDDALGEQQALHEQLNSLRGEVEVARGVIDAYAEGPAEDPAELRAELEEAKKNIEIAVRLRSEAEAQRDKAEEEAQALQRQLDEDSQADAGPLHVPPLNEPEGGNEGSAKQQGSTPASEAGASAAAEDRAPRNFKFVKEAGGGGVRGWPGKALGMGGLAVAALVLWLMLRPESPVIQPTTPVASEQPATENVSATPPAGVPQQQDSPAAVETASRPESAPEAEVKGAEPETRPAAAGAPAEADVPVPAPVRSFRDTLKAGSRGPQMVELPAANYLMGSSGNSLNFDERPQHRVELPSFSISQFEITFAQYDQFARATGRRLPYDEGWGRGDRPVINVSWQDANAYAAWLSKQTGHQYRLPSESEWEFAARGGTTTSHWWAADADAVLPANCFDCGNQWDGKLTGPSGSFAANGFDLHDMTGNVQEWTADCYHPNYQGAPADGSAWQTPGCTRRVVRGGSYTSPLDSLRSAKRGQYDQDARLDNLGFRVARIK